MKILIIKPSALGDIVQALPVLTGLKRHWPQAKIDWVVNDTLKDLLAGHPCLNELIIYPRKRWTSPFRLPEIRRWTKRLRKNKYNITIDLQGLLRTGLMTWAANSPRRIGLQSAREGSRFAYNEIVLDNAVSAAERYLTCLEHMGIPVEPHDFQLRSNKGLPPALQSYGPYIVLHPYSQWKTKLWPWRNYQELIDLMPEHHFVVVGEGPWFPLAHPERLVDLRGQLRLGTLVSVLQSAQAVLSTDSGPAHMAGALGRPTLALFGATNWRKTKPIGPQVTVHTRDLFCSPCLKRSCWRDRPMECMTSITPQDTRHLLLQVINQSVPHQGFV